MNNRTDGRGGGIHNASTLIITNSVMSGNKAAEGGAMGGGWRLRFTSNNSTIAGNSATRKAGGIYNNNHYTDHFDAFDFFNTIVTMNTAPNNPDIYSSFAYTGKNNLVGTNPGFVRNPSSSDNGDVHLASGSPCIDAGYEKSYAKQKDIDGEKRIANGRVDIGADEYH